MFRICLVAFTLLILHSCTVEKRLYRKGFHMEWRNKSAAVSAEVEPVVTETTEIRQKNELSREAATLSAAALPETAASVETAPTISVDEAVNDFIPVVAEIPFINDDSVKVQKQYQEREITQKEIRNYSLTTFLLTLAFLALIALCILTALFAALWYESIALILFAILIFFVMVVVLIFRLTSRPDLVAYRQQQRREYEKKETEGTLTEEDIAAANKKKQNGLIIFGIALSVFAALFFLTRN